MKFPTNELLQLMKNVNNIRNAGFAGHIDHGKTSTSDCLLAYCGVIAPFLAGQVRYLDYLDMEQKRGITIKTAAITLLAELPEGVRYVLNFIDTPGHVDFSGKVSRALRLMDGVIIVVDAVEGIMAQTEAYLRLALEEHVKPILYINKIDRLITELSLTPHQIRARLEEIIVNFNDLIEAFGVDYQVKEWQVDPEKETVFFGCALNCWGFTLPQAIKKGLKFSDIMKILKSNPQQLSKILPLGETIARVIYHKVPNPREAQKRRANYLWIDREAPSGVRECSMEDRTVFYLSKCLVEAGRIFAIGRVFSGKIKVGEYICLNNYEHKRVDAVHLLFGSTSKYVKEIPAGGIFGAFIDARPGQTFASDYLTGFFKLPSYIAVPVVFIAVEPKRSEDFDKLIKELEILKVEDPNVSVEINKDTGEILLGGIGELHLEIIIKDLMEKVELYASEPMIAYRELLISGATVEENGVRISIEPVKDEESLKAILSGKVLNAKDGNILVFKNFPSEEKGALETILLGALKNGPLVGEPIIGAVIKIEKMDAEKVDINDVFVAFSKALSLAKTEICEPYYEFDLSTKPDYVGGIISEVNRRGGKVNSMEAGSGGFIKIKGIIPVRTSIGLPNAVRSIAHGSAYIQLRFYNYLLATDKAREYVMRDIKSRKGLE